LFRKGPAPEARKRLKLGPTRTLVRDEFHQFAHPLLGVVPGDVRLAQHADQIVAVDDRKPPDLVLLHGPDSFLDGVVGSDRHGLAFPEVARLCGARVGASYLPFVRPLPGRPVKSDGGTRPFAVRV